MGTHAFTDGQQAGRRRKLILLAVLCVALVGAVTYNYWSATRYDVDAQTRTLFDFYVTWRCLECGHEIEDRGAVGPRTCPQCGQNEMYVCIRHGCPVHGVFPVAYQYDEKGKPVRLKIADGEWVPYVDEDFNINTHCPRCGRIMLPAEASRPAPPVEKAGEP